MAQKINSVPFKTQFLNALGYLSRPWEKFILELYRKVEDFENGLDQGPRL